MQYNQLQKVLLVNNIDHVQHSNGLWMTGRTEEVGYMFWISCNVASISSASSLFFSFSAKRSSVIVIWVKHTTHKIKIILQYRTQLVNFKFVMRKQHQNGRIIHNYQVNNHKLYTRHTFQWYVFKQNLKASKILLKEHL